MLKLSVVIPTYNRGYILEKTIPTYFSSKYVGEIVIVDNGCKDNTKIIVEKLKNNYPVVYTKTPRDKNLPLARNFGVLTAKYDIVLMGEDDVLLPKDFIENIMEVFLKRTPDILCSKVVYLHDMSEISKYSITYDDFKVITPKTFEELLSLKSVALIKKEVFSRLLYDTKYIGSSYREETDFYLEAIKYNFKVVYASNLVCFNLPRSQVSIGGEWSLSPIWYEITTIYNNFRFYLKHYKFLSSKFYLKKTRIFFDVLKFTYQRLRILFIKIKNKLF